MWQADVPETEGLGRRVVVHIPHASIVIPQDVRDTFLVRDHELELEQLRMTDWYTDELYRGLVAADATICFPVSRLVVDPERFLDDEHEPMAAKGMGATYMRTSDGRALRGAMPASERERLLARFYEPHHRNLTRAAESALADGEKCLIVDGHSFPSRPLPCDLDQTPHRPDICIGTDSRHTPQWLAEAAVDVFARRGLRVEVNRPFSGAIVPAQFYGTDMRVHAVMIEINRRCYMDEATGARLPSFDDFRELVHEALRDLLKAYESHRDLAGIPGRGEAHDLATLHAVMYSEEEDDGYVDKHDEWLAATGDWTFDEIRNVLYGEASDSALLGGGLMPVAGWCRCGDHAELIEGFLSDYGLRYDEEGWVVGMLEEEEEDD